MRRRLLVVLAFASVVGLLASFLVYRVITQVSANARKQPDEEIVVAALNIGLAETVTRQHVKLVPWPKNSVPEGALRSLAEAEGRVVRNSIVAGEPLLEAKLAPQLSGRGGIMPMLVPEGQRGVTIKVDEAIRESGFVLPNSRVDVLVSMAKWPGSQERIAKVILQDVLVLAAGQTVELRDNKPVSVTTVTLALTPDQAERLWLAQVEGRLALATRNLRDNKIVRTGGVNTVTLLGDTPGALWPERTSAGVARAGKPRPSLMAPSAPAPPTPKIEAHMVSVLRGDKVTNHFFVRDKDQFWVELAKAQTETSKK